MKEIVVTNGLRVRSEGIAVTVTTSVNLFSPGKILTGPLRKLANKFMSSI
jgi:hypothetical protein